MASYRKLHAVVAESLVRSGMADSQTDRLYLMPLLPIMDVGENREATTDTGLSFFSVHDVGLIRLIPVRGEVKFSGYFLKIHFPPGAIEVQQFVNIFGHKRPAHHRWFPLVLPPTAALIHGIAADMPSLLHGAPLGSRIDRLSRYPCPKRSFPNWPQ
jgi:hypothetical protein